MAAIVFKLDGKNLLYTHRPLNGAKVDFLPREGDTVRLRLRNSAEYAEYKVARIVHPFSYFPGVECDPEPVEVHVYFDGATAGYKTD